MVHLPLDLGEQEYLLVNHIPDQHSCQRPKGLTDQCSVQAELFLPLPFCHPIPPVLPLTPVAATVAEYRKPSKTLGFSHKP